MTPQDEPNPGGLSNPQWAMMCLLWGARGSGDHDAPAGQVVLRALQRRGLAEYCGTRAKPRELRWRLTWEGIKLMEADYVARFGAARPQRQSSGWMRRRCA